MMDPCCIFLFIFSRFDFGDIFTVFSDFIVGDVFASIPKNSVNHSPQLTMIICKIKVRFCIVEGELLLMSTSYAELS